jgi:branched-chain amino acid transport system ATP-binding protein
MILRAASITKQFGGLTAVSDFSVTIAARERVGLIGPNGAGKTTVFNLLTGAYKPTSGEIAIGGTDTGPLKPDRIVALGVSRTFQNIRLFREMTVLENVMTGFQSRCRAGVFSAIVRSPKHREEERRIRTEALALLERMGLSDKTERISRTLPYGEQRKLEIARALAAQPQLLLLDEPAAGMNDSESDGLRKLLLAICEDFKIALLVIEHDMHFVMGLAQRLLVLDHGATIAQGTPAEIRAHPAVIEAYLGTETGVDPERGG